MRKFPHGSQPFSKKQFVVLIVLLLLSIISFIYLADAYAIRHKVGIDGPIAGWFGSQSSAKLEKFAVAISFLVPVLSCFPPMLSSL